MPLHNYNRKALPTGTLPGGRNIDAATLATISKISSLPGGMDFLTGHGPPPPGINAASLGISPSQPTLYDPTTGGLTNYGKAAQFSSQNNPGSKISDYGLNKYSWAGFNPEQQAGLTWGLDSSQGLPSYARNLPQQSYLPPTDPGFAARRYEQTLQQQEGLGYARPQSAPNQMAYAPDATNAMTAIANWQAGGGRQMPFSGQVNLNAAAPQGMGLPTANKRHYLPPGVQANPNASGAITPWTGALNGSTYFGGGG